MRYGYTVRHVGFLALLVAVVLAGCGGSDDARPKGPITSAQVIAGFTARAGAPLVAEDETPAYDRLDFGDDADQRLTDAFGSFTLYVLKRDADGNFARLTESSDDDFSKQIYEDPDAQGIVWGGRCFKESGHCDYTATKRFAANVVVVWGAAAARTTNASWRRLSAAVTGIVKHPPAVQAAATTTTAAPPVAPTTVPAAGGKPIPASRVIAAFEQRAHLPLTRNSDNPDWDALGPAALDGATLSAAGRRVIDRYSAFTVYALKGDLDAGYARLAEPPPDDGDLSHSAEPPDAEGIVWTKTCTITSGCSYGATKRFGAGLVLVWQAGQAKGTDPRWDRLAAILTAISR